VPFNILVFKWIRYMSPKSHTYKRCGILRKKSFSARGYVESHTYTLVLRLHIEILFLRNAKISIFNGISKFFKLIIFGQIWAVLGKFGQILLHSQWLTTCPKLGWNLKILITFEPWVQTLCIASHCKATIYIYNLQKVSKNPKIYCIYNNLPKIPKFHIWNS
jgi:hypothetical protein